MRHPSSSATAVIVIFILVLVPIGETNATPYSYEFTSGALTGQFAVSPYVVTGEGPLVQSWHISVPTGFGTTVWDSTNPAQGIFANDPFCQCLVLLSEATSLRPNSIFSFNFQGTSPNQGAVAGSYVFLQDVKDTQLELQGSGNWVMVTEPNTLWSLALGLLTFIAGWWLKIPNQGLR